MKKSYRAKDNVCPFLSVRTDSSGELHFFKLFNIYGERISSVMWDKSLDSQNSDEPTLDKYVPSVNAFWTPF